MFKIIKTARTFLNDEDGVSAKDFIMLGSFILFATSYICGLIFVIIGRDLSKDFFDLMSIGNPVVMTVVASVMGVAGIEVVSNAIVRHKDESPSNQTEVSTEVKEVSVPKEPYDEDII